jgi:hypothetical protein
MQRFRLKSSKQNVPMPERGSGVLFTSEKTGEAIDPMNPYYARMIASGELVSVDPEDTSEGSSKSPKGA